MNLQDSKIYQRAAMGCLLDPLALNNDEKRLVKGCPFTTTDVFWMAYLHIKEQKNTRRTTQACTLKTTGWWTRIVLLKGLLSCVGLQGGEAQMNAWTLGGSCQTLHAVLLCQQQRRRIGVVCRHMDMFVQCLGEGTRQEEEGAPVRRTGSVTEMFYSKLVPKDMHSPAGQETGLILLDHSRRLTKKGLDPGSNLQDLDFCRGLHAATPPQRVWLVCEMCFLHVDSNPINILLFVFLSHQHPTVDKPNQRVNPYVCDWSKPSLINVCTRV